MSASCLKYWPTLILILSAINWGIVGLFRTDLIGLLLPGRAATLAYVAVGLVGLLYGLCWMVKKKSIGPLRFASLEDNTTGMVTSDDDDDDEWHKHLFPYGILKPNEPDHYNLEIPIHVPSRYRAKYVVYWAADASNNPRVMSVKDAYNLYENSGVAEVDANGAVILRLAYPQPYWIPKLNKGVLPPHLHYRIVTLDGTISSVFTMQILSKHKLRPRNHSYGSKYTYI